MSKNLISSRKIIYFGCGSLPNFTDGTKVTFHFKTEKAKDNVYEVIDDSKQSGKPMELIIGKQFKLIIWEEWLKNMRIGEVSQLLVEKSLCHSYAFVSKCYRQYCDKDNKVNGEEEQPSHHCCGMSLKHGIGYKDLDQLIENPHDLRFTIELLKVEPPEQYEQEIWQMNEQEMLTSIPRYREEGNRLYANKMFSEAEVMYSKAISIIEQLLLKEKPGDEEWLKLDQMKIPLLCNYSQCKIISGDFYAAIEHTSEVLKRDKENVKALFRRAKAHSAVWNIDDARNDFNKVCQLDSSLEKAVRKELKMLELAQKQKNKQDMSLLKGKLFV